MLEEIYHKRIHGTTGDTPINRYLDDGKNIRKAPTNYPGFSRNKEMIIVNNDRTVKLRGKIYKAPQGLIGHQVTLRYENTDRIVVFLNNESKGFLTQLNTVVKNRVKRNIDDADINRNRLYKKGKGL